MYSFNTDGVDDSDSDDELRDLNYGGKDALLVF